MIVRIVAVCFFMLCSLIIVAANLISEESIDDLAYSESRIVSYTCTPKRVGNFLQVKFETGNVLSRTNTRSGPTCPEVEDLLAKPPTSGVKVWFTIQREIMQLELGRERIFDFHETISGKNSIRSSAVGFLIFLSFLILVDIYRLRQNQREHNQRGQSH